MPIGVVRFGGNSLNNTALLEAFVNQLKQETGKVVVVVSAIPELLTLLNDGLQQVCKNRSDYKQFTDRVAVILSSAFAKEQSAESNKSFALELEQLEALLNGVQLTGDYSPALRDQVLSYAERLSVTILNDYLKSQGVDVAVEFPEKFQFLVTDEPGEASVLYDVVPSFSSENKVVLVPGTYGVNEKGRIIRAGFNASDYTAAALARQLNASSLELWGTDAPFHTADNEIVPEAASIDELTYSEASELAYFSHSVLHPRTVEPLLEENIPICIFRLEKDGKIPETTISGQSSISERVVKSVASTDEIAILQLNGPGVGFKPGILAKVTSAFHQQGINIRSVITSQISINIILDKSKVSEAREICRKLILNSVNELVIHDQVTLIAVVGHGMQTHHGVSSRLFKAVADHQINVLLSGSGASDLVSYLVIDQNEKKKAIQEIHRIFFS